MKKKRKEFVENFLNAFAKDISKETLKSRFIGWGRHRCLWNLFAEPLVPCFWGEEAKKLYDKADKGEAMEIAYWINKSKETAPLSDGHYDAEGATADRWMDLYIVGRDFSWCFVTTHEDGCFEGSGPYFCYKK